MFRPRLALVAVAATATFVPAGSASAAIDGAEAVRANANNAAELLVAEVTLIGLADPTVTTSPDELAAIAEQLRTVDERGKVALVQLRGLDVELTAAIESSLERLPLPPETRGAVSRVAQIVVYEAAIDDLLRIASTPGAVSPVGPSSGTPSSALLLVATASMMLLGGAALASTLRRREETPELESMAWSDDLTGLPNRRRLGRDLAVHERDRTSTAVIMIDLDQFTWINDEYGHPAGDRILRRLGTLLSLHIRSNDVAYRYGSEAFCVLLPGATDAEARLVASRFVRAARTINLPNGANATVSVGVALAEGHAVFDALEVADQARFRAVRAGRDRAVFADHLVAS